MTTDTFTISKYKEIIYVLPFPMHQPLKRPLIFWYFITVFYFGTLTHDLLLPQSLSVDFKVACKSGLSGLKVNQIKCFC